VKWQFHHDWWDLPHQSWDHSVTDGKATVIWIVLNHTRGWFLLLLYTAKGRLILPWCLDSIRSLGSGGRHMAAPFSPLLDIHQREVRNKRAFLCTSADNAFLWSGICCYLVVQKISHFPYVLEMSLLSFMVQITTHKGGVSLHSYGPWTGMKIFNRLK
jgi:hypothetical protein